LRRPLTGAVQIATRVCPSRRAACGRVVGDPADTNPIAAGKI